MNKKQIGNAKVLAVILVITILIVSAIMFRAVRNSSYSPSQNNQEVTSQSIDLNQESQNLDSSDQDFNSMDSSLNELGADSNSF